MMLFRRIFLMLPLFFTLLISTVILLTRAYYAIPDAESGFLYLNVFDNSWYWMRIDGTDIRQLVDFTNIRPPDNSRVLGGVLSPDNGSLLVTSGFLDSLTLRYWLVNRQTHDITTLLYPESGDKDFVWSPDSRFIAYLSGRTLYVVNAETGDLHVVAYLSNIPGAMYFNTITWSPDSQQIAFDVAVGVNRFAIYIINQDGSGLRLLDDQNAENPVWDIASNQLYFACGALLSEICVIDMNRNITVRLNSLSRQTRYLERIHLVDALEDRLILFSAVGDIASLSIYDIAQDTRHWISVNTMGAIRWFDEPTSQ